MVEEVFVPYGRVITTIIVIGCLIAVITVIASSDGIVATNLQEIVSLMFQKGKEAIGIIGDGGAGS
ncbi:MAG: hypothetical protein IJ419_15345 [Agathobacter sp.]|nr:hypothetical protein [Agathobacter sp.]